MCIDSSSRSLIILLQLYSEVNFTCEFVGVDTFDEGLEVSFLNWNRTYRRNEWVPVHYFAAHDPSVRTEQNISLGDLSRELLVLRGYPVNFTVAGNQTGTVVEATIKLCGPNVFSPSTEDQLYNWEFRWLQTAARDDDNDTDGDSIYISNITITVVNFNDTQRIVIFEDNFEDNRYDGIYNRINVICTEHACNRIIVITLLRCIHVKPIPVAAMDRQEECHN